MKATELLSQQKELQNELDNSLRELLDKKLQDLQNFVPVSKISQNSKHYFLGPTSLKWIHNNVRLAIKMPLLEKKVDSNGKLKLDKASVVELKQRQPVYERGFAIANYAIRNKNAFFPPLTIVVSKDWVDDPESSKYWNDDKTAKQNSLKTIGLDSEHLITLLNISDSDTHLYVIDGQHRLLAIKELNDSLSDGVLKKHKTPSKVIQRLKLSDINANRDEVSRILSDTIGVVFIPAVLKGETRVEANRRIKGLFTAVNQTAKPLNKSQLQIMDPESGISAVAIQIAFGHKFYQDGEWMKSDGSDVKATEQKLHPFGGLHDAIKGYFKSHETFSKWSDYSVKKGEVGERPDEDEIESAIELCKELFDALSEITSFNNLINGRKTCKTLREFPPSYAVDSVDPNQGFLFSRHPAFTALLSAIGFCHFEKKQSLNDIINLIKKADSEGKFNHFNQWGSMWCNLLWDKENSKIIASKHVTLMERMFKYLIGQTEVHLYDQLKEDYKNARTIVEANKVWNWDGTELKIDKDGKILQGVFNLPNKF